MQPPPCHGQSSDQEAPIPSIATASTLSLTLRAAFTPVSGGGQATPKQQMDHWQASGVQPSTKHVTYTASKARLYQQQGGPVRLQCDDWSGVATTTCLCKMQLQEVTSTGFAACAVVKG